MGIIISLIIGAFCGWLAGKIMDSQFSWIGNIALGLCGGLVGGLVLGAIGITGHGFLGNIIAAVIGACLLIAIGRAIKK